MNKSIKMVEQNQNKITLDIDSKDLIKIRAENQRGYEDNNRSNEILIKDDGIIIFSTRSMKFCNFIYINLIFTINSYDYIYNLF